ncbi:MAG: MmcQ/YjbR family DNA-binding protein [Mucinivorans sp.]
MNVEELREYCLSKRGATECAPFGDNTIVFKVGPEEHGRAFALMPLDKRYVMVKCNPQRAIALRERYPEIEAAYHMNKVHWNGVFLEGSLSDSFIRELIDHSFDMVLQGFPKRIRDNFML